MPLRSAAGMSFWSTRPVGEEDTGDVGLGFFKAGEGRADGLVDGELLAADVGPGGAEAVRELVQDDGGKVAPAGDILGLFGRHQLLRDGQDDLVDAGVHEILEEDLLRAFFCVDARVVGEVVGDGLVAVTEIACAQRRVGDNHRRGVAFTCWAWLRRGWGGASLHGGLVLLVHGELAGLGVVADKDGGAVGGLHTEQVVEVGLVGREDEVDLRVLEVEPGNVGRVVVVRRARRRRGRAEGSGRRRGRARASRRHGGRRPVGLSHWAKATW